MWKILGKEAIYIDIPATWKERMLEIVADDDKGKLFKDILAKSNVEYIFNSQTLEHTFFIRLADEVTPEEIQTMADCVLETLKSLEMPVVEVVDPAVPHVAGKEPVAPKPRHRSRRAAGAAQRLPIGGDGGVGAIVEGRRLKAALPAADLVQSLGAEQGRLFAAGIIPGIILLVGYILACSILCVINPSLGPKGQGYPMKEKLKSLLGLIPIVVLFAAVIGGMFSGIFSATEAAAVGCFLAFIYTVLVGKFSFKGFLKALGDSVKSICMVFLIMLGAYVFGYFLTATHLPQDLASLATGMNVNRYVIMLIIVVIYFLLGMVMDTGPAIIILAPVLLPAVQELGVHDVHFGVILVCCLSIGLATPPFGLDLFVSGNLAEEQPMAVAKKAIPFIIAFLIALFLITYVPALVTWLPGLMG